MKSKIKKNRITKKDVEILYKLLLSSKNEKDVESAWRQIFLKYFIENNPDRGSNITMTSPYGSDGFISDDSASTLLFALRILLEFKDKTDLTKAYDRAKITAQVIYYMKKFSNDGRELPNIVVGADENQVFVLYAPNFYKYLDNEDYDWDIAPSEAYKKNSELISALIEDKNLSVWVYDLHNSNKNTRYEMISQLFEEIEAMADENNGDIYKVKITPSNITGMFDEFVRIAIKNPKDIAPVDMVNIFHQLLIGGNDSNYYLLPNNPNKLHIPGDVIIDVNGAALNAFFKHFDRDLTPREIDEFVEIADRLVEDTSRRRTGDFWTPTVWASRADEMLSEVLGDSYKEECIIWDCACGTKNLTRDSRYNDLYNSTLFEAEIELGSKYNREGIAFQYDFLNDDVNLTPSENPNPDSWKMPNKLFEELMSASRTGKRIVFFTNPPYGTSNNMEKDGTSKKDMALTEVNKWMKSEGYGSASQQLYTQFFARVQKLSDDFNLSNVTIGFFSKPRFFSGGDYWKRFNDKFFADFEFVKGNLLNSGEFNDTADTWPITFSIYNRNKDNNSKLEAVFSIEKTEWINSEIKITNMGYHKMTPIYGNSLSNWAKKDASREYLVRDEYFTLSSALKKSTGVSPRGKLTEGSIGYIVNNANNIGKGTIQSGVYLFGSAAYEGNGFNIDQNNIEKVCVNFTARRCVTPTWYNEQDNYSKPNINHPNYQEFINDAIIFTLFDNQNFICSYRDFDYTNTNVPGKWINNWFWLDTDTMTEIFNQRKLVELYDDIRGDGNRVITDIINNRILSDEAKNVLDSANRILIETMEYRQIAMNDNPSLHINSWDAGWYQIKQLAKYGDVDFSDFRKHFSILREKCENNVYILGMLEK